MNIYKLRILSLLLREINSRSDTGLLDRIDAIQSITIAISDVGLNCLQEDNHNLIVFLDCDRLYSFFSAYSIEFGVNLNININCYRTMLFRNCSRCAARHDPKQMMISLDDLILSTNTKVFSSPCQVNKWQVAYYYLWYMLRCIVVLFVAIGFARAVCVKL